MTRSVLANRLALNIKVSKEEANRYLNAFTNAIVTGLKKDKRIVLQGFGSFCIKNYEERIGQKPITGEPVLIPKRSKPVFRPGKELRQMVNRNGHYSKTFEDYDFTQAKITTEL